MRDHNQHLNFISRRMLLTLVVYCAAFFASPLPAEEANTVAQKDNTPEYSRSVVTYETPNVSVTRNDGKKLSFIKELDDGRPVIMNFIFASCTAICPMISHVFSKVQSKLGKDSRNVHRQATLQRQPIRPNL